MEVIPQDPQLAHEFCKFLGEKLKDMKALLDAAVQENELLRREIHTLRREPRHLTNQDRMYSGDEKPQLEVGCREGSCPSAHEVQLLQERNQELEELLNSQSVAHEAKTDEMKEKLEAAISKYKECKLKLRTCRQELQNNKGLPEAPRDENIEIRNKEIDETARGKASILRLRDYGVSFFDIDIPDS
ncbi:hypothetical protein PHLCEN_2v11614 [Hermanssonia centrifuga]|uniref:Uncharacterized protein n=1 Tax=Hermanssonia centrifuga TaxID=98765 RepID=A0A2R6NJI1_9APHY|nr:hypothetical protein PHLCEN_2v11614 [Hermanssonia centrifuga]